MGLLSSPMGKNTGNISLFLFQKRKKNMGQSQSSTFFSPRECKMLHIFDFNCISTDLGSKVEKKTTNLIKHLSRKMCFRQTSRAIYHLILIPTTLNILQLCCLKEISAMTGWNDHKWTQLLLLGCAEWLPGMQDCEQVGIPRVGENTRPLTRHSPLTISSKKRTRFESANIQMCLFCSRNAEFVLSI